MPRHADPDGEALSVVALAAADETAIGELLARSFAHDPIFLWVEPDPVARREFLRPFMAALARRSRLLAVALTTAPRLAGASLWKGPGLGALSAEQLALSGLDRIGEWLSAEALARFEALFDPIDASLQTDIESPYWYLGCLGVAPQEQGRGLGTRLMRPVLDRADGDGLAVALETAQPRNLPLYRRHGFEVLRELPPPRPGAPVVWTMLRPPRPESEEGN